MALFRVRCIDNTDTDGELTLGEIYNAYKSDRHYYYLEGDEDGWYKSRFEVVEEGEAVEEASPTTDQPDLPSVPAPAPTFDFDTYNSTIPGRK